MNPRAMELAQRFEAAVAEFAKTVERVTPAEWGAVCEGEGWTVAQTAQHVSGQIPFEMEFITAAAEARTMPNLTWDELNSKNEGRAERNRTVTPAEVLKELRANAASTGAYIRGLTDEQLDRTGPLSLADGASVSTQQLIEGPVLIAHVLAHLESIRNAAVPVVSGA